MFSKGKVKNKHVKMNREFKTKYVNLNNTKDVASQNVLNMHH